MHIFRVKTVCKECVKRIAEGSRGDAANELATQNTEAVLSGAKVALLLVEHQSRLEMAGWRCQVVPNYGLSYDKWVCPECAPKVEEE